VLHRADLLRRGVEGDWCGRDVLLHMAAWLPIGHVDGERLETLVPRAGAESAHGVLHAPLIGEALGRGWRCTCLDTRMSEGHRDIGGNCRHHGSAVGLCI
jgi:hypothetical protein